MPREINPKDTKRAMAYELWIKAPNPMVTFFKTLDVTNLIKVSKKRQLKFNQKEGLIPRSLLRNKLFQDMEEVIY